MSKAIQLSDQEVIDLILQGENSMNRATSYVLNNYGDRIKHHILEMSQNMEEAEDALYEGVAAFLLNVRKGSFKGDSSISSYLFAICRRIWFKKFKRMMLHKQFEEHEMNMHENKYDDNVLTKDLKRGLEVLLGTVKEKCREVLQLWALSYNMTEIAQKLSYSSPQIVMNKKNLCLKEIRKQLREKPQLAQLIN